MLLIEISLRCCLGLGLRLRVQWRRRLWVGPSLRQLLYLDLLWLVVRMMLQLW